MAAVDQSSGLVVGQGKVDSHSNEIPAVRQLAGRTDMQGRVVTLDAIHALRRTARCLLEGCGVRCVFKDVKDNQPTIRVDIQCMSFNQCPSASVARRPAVASRRAPATVRDLTGPEWNDYEKLPDRIQVIGVLTERLTIKTGRILRGLRYAITSLPAGNLIPQQLGQMIRRHWRIENRVFSSRAFSVDEDRCRRHVRGLTGNLAARSDTAISIVRC